MNESVMPKKMRRKSPVRSGSIIVSRHQIRRNPPTTCTLDTTNHQPRHDRHRPRLVDRPKSALCTSFEGLSLPSAPSIPTSSRSAPNSNRSLQKAASSILVVKTQSESLRYPYGSENTNSSRGSSVSTKSLGVESLASRMSNVSFDKVCVREYPRIIGDSVPSSGPPISIDWNHQSHEEMSVDEYECSRPIECKRSRDDLKMDSSDRVTMLESEWETSLYEIMRASLESSSVRENRLKTRRRPKSAERVAELVESARHSLKKVSLKTKIKRRSALINHHHETYLKP